MKTQMNRILAVAVFAALFMSGNVNAKETKVNVVSGHENTLESKLELENWMVDEVYWKGKFVKAEETLALEAWMLDESLWNVPAFDYPVAERDNQLEIENWMVNEQYWN